MSIKAANTSAISEPNCKYLQTAKELYKIF